MTSKSFKIADKWCQSRYYTLLLDLTEYATHEVPLKLRLTGEQAYLKGIFTRIVRIDTRMVTGVVCRFSRRVSIVNSVVRIVIRRVRTFTRMVRIVIIVTGMMSIITRMV